MKSGINYSNKDNISVAFQNQPLDVKKLMTETYCLFPISVNFENHQYLRCFFWTSAMISVSLETTTSSISVYQII